MIDQKRAKWGIIVYLLLIISGSFSDTPIFSLLTLPVFLVSIVIGILFLLGLPDHPKTKKWFASTLLILGAFALAATVFTSALETTEYLVAVSRNAVDKFFPTPWINALKILLLMLVSSFLIAAGVKEKTRWPPRIIFPIWLLSFLAAPLTALILGILYLIGFPLGT